MSYRNEDPYLENEDNKDCLSKQFESHAAADDDDGDLNVINVASISVPLLPDEAWLIVNVSQALAVRATVATAAP